MRTLVAIFVIAVASTACTSPSPSDQRINESPTEHGAASTQPARIARSAAPSGGTPEPSLSTELPARVVVAELGIDLAVISGDTTLPGNPRDYPLCGVAQYLTTYRYLGRDGGTTWIYAHAREGMFLPLLEASRRRDGAELIGMTVDVHSNADRVHRYRIVEVLRHATHRGIAREVPAESRLLVLQTSEGPRGTVPKLQVAAALEEVVDGSADRGPVASPTECFIP